MFKKLHIALGIVISVSLLLAACGTAATPTTAPSTGGTAALFVGEVTDTGGIDDKSFNALGWQGVQDAISQLGIEGKYLQSNQGQLITKMFLCILFSFSQARKLITEP